MVEFRRDIYEELTDCPGKMKVLNITRSVVNTMDAIVRAPTPIRSADAGLCSPRGPRLMAIVTVEVKRNSKAVLLSRAGEVE